MIPGMAGGGDKGADAGGGGDGEPTEEEIAVNIMIIWILCLELWENNWAMFRFPADLDFD